MVSHLVQPVRQLPIASLLPFLLRPPVGHPYGQRLPPCPRDDLARSKLCGSPVDGADRVAPGEQHSLIVRIESSQ